jgi:hypothetical protein
VVLEKERVKAVDALMSEEIKFVKNDKEEIMDFELTEEQKCCRKW